MLVVIQILIPQRQPEDSLSRQRPHRVLDPPRIPVIVEALGKVPNPTAPSFHFPQQQPAPIAAQLPATEIHLHFAPTQPLKLKHRLFTLCHDESCSCVWYICLSHKYL